ncbi:MAG: serine/threonine-protein kinase [Planctomycetaceae bacterium]
MKIFRELFGKKTEIRPIDITRRFDLIGRVGQGSMARVWRARDTKTGKIVALKVLDKEKTARLESRFINLGKPSEGEIAVQLRHPRLVHTFEYGYTKEREQWLMMEFIEGASLSFLIEMQNETMLANRMKFMIELGEGVDYLHKHGWIHRDICPRNVLLDENNDLKLIDFGLVVPDTAEFRKPGNRTGTATYMAPELIRRQPTDHRIDVFSYAVTCYEMWTKARPWKGADSLDAMHQAINTPPRDIRELAPDIDERVAQTIMKGLEREPRDRWSSAGKMADAFRAIADQGE